MVTVEKCKVTAHAIVEKIDKVRKMLGENETLESNQY